VACLPLVLRFRTHLPTGFSGQSPKGQWTQPASARSGLSKTQAPPQSQAAAALPSGLMQWPAAMLLNAVALAMAKPSLLLAWVDQTPWLKICIRS